MKIEYSKDSRRVLSQLNCEIANKTSKSIESFFLEEQHEMEVDGIVITVQKVERVLTSMIIHLFLNNKLNGLFAYIETKQCKPIIYDIHLQNL